MAGVGGGQVDLEALPGDAECLGRVLGVLARLWMQTWFRLKVAMPIAQQGYLRVIRHLHLLHISKGVKREGKVCVLSEEAIGTSCVAGQRVMRMFLERG